MKRTTFFEKNENENPDLHKKSKLIPLPLFCVLLLSLLLNAYGIWWGLPGSRGWAPDELIPSIIINGAREHFLNGWYQVYPPFHYFILAFFYFPLFVLHEFHWIDIQSSSANTILFFLGRSVSILFGLGILIILYLLGREILDKKASIFATLIMTLMAPFVYYAKIANVDIPSVFWYTLSLLFYIRILKNHRLKDYLLFAASGALSICTKDQAYGFYVLTPLAIVMAHYSTRKKENPSAKFTRSLFNRKTIGAILLAVLLILLFQNILFNFQGFRSHVRLLTDWAREYGRIYEKSLLGHLRMLVQTLKHLQFSLGWPVSIICLLGLLASLVQKKKNQLLLWTLIPGVSYYIFLISITLSNYVRYLIPLWVILALFGGKFLAEFLNLHLKLYKIKVLLVGLVFFYTFIYSGSVNILMARDSRYAVEKWMKANIPSRSLVGTVNSKEYLPRLDGFNWVLLKPNRQSVEQRKPDYLIINADYNYMVEKDNERHKFYVELKNRRIPYKMVWTYKYTSKWILLDYRGIYTNLNKINPRIQVFKRGY